MFTQDVLGVSDLLKSVSSYKGDFENNTFSILHAKAKADNPRLMDLKTLNRELHGLLTKVTDGTAGVLMRGYEGNGREGWRRLHDEYDASTRRSRRTLLRKVLGPTEAKSYGDVSAAQAAWDDDVRRFKEATMEMTKEQLIAEMMMVAMETLYLSRWLRP